MKNHMRKSIAKKNQCDGFSLIETAIAVVVIGLLLVPVIQVYQYNILSTRTNVTRENMDLIKTALQKYYFINKRLPCPAEINRGESFNNYGRESIAGVNCVAGAGVFINANVAVGGIPFADLGIKSHQTLDGWSDKITYAVSVNKTIAPINLDADTSDLLVQYYNNVHVAQLPLRAFYVLVSAGQNGFGAYTADGVLKAACPPAATNLEAINCDNNAVFLDDINVHSDAAERYDDVVDYATRLDEVIWAFTPGQTTDIFSNGYVGVNSDLSAPQYALDVVGNVLACSDSVNCSVATVKGTANTTLMANFNTINPFPPSIIGGTGMGAGIGVNCASTSAMSGIAGKNGQNADYALCQPGYTGHAQDCALGTYVVGFDGNGNIKCQ